MEVFAPGRVTVSLSVNEDVPACGWAQSLAAPPGYKLAGSASARFDCGGCVHHYSLAASGKPDDLPGSPATVLDNIMSTMSLTGMAPFNHAPLSPCDLLTRWPQGGCHPAQTRGLLMPMEHSP